MNRGGLNSPPGNDEIRVANGRGFFVRHWDFEFRHSPSRGVSRSGALYRTYGDRFGSNIRVRKGLPWCDLT